MLPLSHFQDCEGRRWPVTVMTLAEAFELDTDVLKQFYATQLVSHGYDVLALEVCYYVGQDADEGKLISIRIYLWCDR